MELTPFRIWLLSFAGAAVAFCAIPELRLPLGIAILAGLAVIIRGVVDLRSQLFCPALWRGAPAALQVALTFDDGPDPQITSDILAILQRYGFVATFFVIAEKVRQHPDLCRRALAKGHTIACHDLTHDNFANFRFARPAERDLRQALDIIQTAIGRRPRLYRPPVGLMNPHIARARARLGLRCIGWSRSARDGGNRSLSAIRRIGTLAGPGEVVLLHDVLPEPTYREELLFQIDRLCAEIKRQGLQPVGIGTLFGVEEYKEGL
jgi:peptidoglycan/xylan/chitin deacetylase (PgdA/CDA1 family)